jgi:hypothetical protein
MTDSADLILIMGTMITFSVAFTIVGGTMYVGSNFWLPILSLTTMRTQRKLAKTPSSKRFLTKF